jgi:hypothetical protein
MLKEEVNCPHKVSPYNTPAFLVEQGCEAIRAGRFIIRNREKGCFDLFICDWLLKS